MDDMLAEIRKDNLVRFMEDKELIPAFVARTVEISASTIQNYKIGKTAMSNKAATRMCEHFELGFGWFDVDRRNRKLDYPDPADLGDEFLNMRCWSDDGNFDITLKLKKDTAREFILDLFES